MAPEVDSYQDGDDSLVLHLEKVPGPAGVFRIFPVAGTALEGDKVEFQPVFVLLIDIVHSLTLQRLRCSSYLFYVSLLFVIWVYFPAFVALF